MRLLRLAIETQKWDLAAHILIMGAITARQKQSDNTATGRKKKRRPQGQKRP